MIEPSILFEDDYLLIIDKPPHVVVNRASTVKNPTIQDWAEKKLEIMNVKDVLPGDDFHSRAGLVHRIDKETSGCLIIAKNEKVFYLCQKLFKERKVKKTYVALVHGEVKPKKGTINVPVGRLPWNRKRFGIVPGGKEALTTYEVEKSFVSKVLNGEMVSRVLFFPLTGRTHQIRVHAKHIGHPLVGDEVYAGRKTSRRDRKVVNRCLLHACSISFSHPVSKNTISIKAPIPDDFLKVV